MNRSNFHLGLYHKRSINWPLLTGLYTRTLGAANWPISNITNWLGSKTRFIQVSHDPRFILSTKSPIHSFCKLFYQLQRFPNELGYFRDSSGIGSIIAGRLSSSHLRHFSSLPYHASSSRPTELPVHRLGRNCQGGPSCDVWTVIKCGGVWQCSRHAYQHLSFIRLWPHSQMGRRLPGHPAARHKVDRGTIHRPYSRNQDSMEHGENATIGVSSEIYWIRLASRHQVSERSHRKIGPNPFTSTKLAIAWLQGTGSRCSKPSWQAGSYFGYLSNDSSVPTVSLRPCGQFSITSSTPTSAIISPSGHALDPKPTRHVAQSPPSLQRLPHRFELVGRCELVLWYWSHNWWEMGSMEICTWSLGRPKETVRHRMGRSSCSGARPLTGHFVRPDASRPFPSTLRQCWCHLSSQQRALTELKYQHSFKEYLFNPCIRFNPPHGRVCAQPSQCGRRIIKGRYHSLFERLPWSAHQIDISSPRPFITAISHFIVATAFTSSHPPPSSSTHHQESLKPLPSLLRPACKAEERIFVWRGVNTPPPAVIDNPVIQAIASLASHNSLRDTTNY